MSYPKCTNCGGGPAWPSTGLCGPCTTGEASTVGTEEPKAAPATKRTLDETADWLKRDDCNDVEDVIEIAEDLISLLRESGRERDSFQTRLTAAHVSLDMMREERDGANARAHGLPEMVDSLRAQVKELEQSVEDQLQGRASEVIPLTNKLDEAEESATRRMDLLRELWDWVTGDEPTPLKEIREKINAELQGQSWQPAGQATTDEEGPKP